MTITYPHTIENCLGEKIIFHEVQKEADGDRLLVESFVTPGCGPVMHTHWMQDEALTVIKGKFGYQVKGQAEKYVAEGETVIFERGTAHRFWNAGQDVLHCKGWLKPANTIVFFLSSIYAAQNKSGKARPEQFDAAYLLQRYAAEYDMTEMPKLVKKTIVPITYQLGKLLRKYTHFKDAPDPITKG